MGLTKYTQGSVICSVGDPMRQIMFIANGRVQATLSNWSLTLEQGDILGICDLDTGIYSFTFTATSDAQIFSYPNQTPDALEIMLQDKKDLASLLVSSMCRQMLQLLQYRNELKGEATNAYQTIKDVYANYKRLCSMYAFTSKMLPGAEEAAPFEDVDSVAEWLQLYYTETIGLDNDIRRGLFNNHLGITAGLLRRSAEDGVRILEACRNYINYLEGVAPIFLNDEQHDLFAMVSDLHLNSVAIKGADADVGAVMARLAECISGMTATQPKQYDDRLTAYRESLITRRKSPATANTPAASGLKQNLSGSLDIIMEYADCPKEISSKFARNVQDYSHLPDRSGDDDVARGLRKELTETFYDIYLRVFTKSLSDTTLPTVIKMFLNFGYVDADLAGHQNAEYLYSIADSLCGDPSVGVYTIREWLTAVYQGQKDPSQNELAEDFTDYANLLKAEGKIDEKGKTKLLADMNERLRYEMENVFPSATKVTYGLMASFCPLFSDHNVQQDLSSTLVTPTTLKGLLDEVRAIDFSAFFRQMMFSAPEMGSTKEDVHIEILPDFILMPTVGTRGTMWQEIEGKKRNSSARIFMPMFLQSDLKNLFVHIIGEFRWEMCKRIQGVRWNDVAEHCLTSEYYDYLQFYKSNRNLSPALKESVKNELTRARNNFKAAFAQNYADWVLYEANGSSRLNKIARQIMVDHCPFPAELRESLKLNPRFTEPLTRYDTLQEQRVQQLNRIIGKVKRVTDRVPQELLDELEYAKR